MVKTNVTLPGNTFERDFVSTVGRDESVIRHYIRHQEQEDKRQNLVEPLALIATLRWLKIIGAALATPFSRFERLTC